MTLGGGSLSVAGNLTNDGSIWVNAGCADYACGMYFGGSLGVGGSLMNNGSISVASDTRVGSEVSVDGDLTNNGVLTLGFEYGSPQMIVGGNFTNIGGASVNGGTLNVAGTLTNQSVLLQGRDAYGNTVNTGGLWLGNDAVVTAAAVNNSGSILIDKGSQLTVNASGPYNQSAGLTDVNGTLVATDVNINGGTLMGTGFIEGSVADGAAAVTIGSGATFQPAGNAMMVDGSFSLSGIFDENIDSASNSGALFVEETADIAGGTLDIDLPDGDSFLTNGETFPILFASGGLSGTFSTINGLDFGTGGTWLVNYTADEVILTAHTPEPASLLLFGTGFLGLGLLLARKKAFGSHL